MQRFKSFMLLFVRTTKKKKGPVLVHALFSVFLFRFHKCIISIQGCSFTWVWDLTMECYGCFLSRSFWSCALCFVLCLCCLYYLYCICIGSFLCMGTPYNTSCAYLVVAPNFLHFVYHFANIVFILVEELEINVELNRTSKTCPCLYIKTTLSLPFLKTCPVMAICWKTKPSPTSWAQLPVNLQHGSTLAASSRTVHNSQSILIETLSCQPPVLSEPTLLKRDLHIVSP